jgi:hypothetical protein
MLADPFLGNRDGATETPLVKRTRQGWPWFDRMTAFLRSDWPLCANMPETTLSFFKVEGTENLHDRNGQRKS